MRTVDVDHSPFTLCCLKLKIETETGLKAKMQKKTLTKTAAGGARALPVEKTASSVAQIRPTNPSQDQIAQRAYEIFVARGQVSGRALEDWVQAERELTGRVHTNN